MSSTAVTLPLTDAEGINTILDIPDMDIHAHAVLVHRLPPAAADVIARELAARGMMVLRCEIPDGFDDVKALLQGACQYLGRHHEAPALLVGHDTGGTVALEMAGELDCVRAVVTIGSPRGVRPLQLDNRALLILHSPADHSVSIDEAARIYQDARHPKSFISLDKAGHALTEPADARYVAEAIAGWAGHYLGRDRHAPMNGAMPHPVPGHVIVHERNREYTRDVYMARHHLVADEPLSLEGTDLGPNPYEFLLTALGSCTSMTIRMYANRKGIPLEDIVVELWHSRIHAEDCADCDAREGMIDVIDKRIRLTGNLDEAQRQRLLEIADKCPVHRTLLNEIRIHTQLIE